jgi:NAD(P)-dependent dehydrogenase (short-subunit alcohol dehydrogenase family)
LKDESAAAKVAVVVGAGPGIGMAVARKFTREGFRVGLIGRRADALEAFRAELPGSIAAAGDVTDAASLARAFASIREQAGDPSVLVYNASGPFKMAGILELTTEDFESAFSAGCTGAFHAVREVLPAMVKSGRGTIVFTGATAALRGGARFSTLAIPKFGLRALSQSIAREFGPQGIHAAHVIIDGGVLSERAKQWAPDRPEDGFLSPDAVADAYWMLHSQNRSTWTQELDLRPYMEKF